METELLKKVFEDVMLFKSPETGASFGRLLSVLHKEQLLVEKIRELGANGHSEICNRWLHAYQTKEQLPDVPQLVQADLKSIEHTIFAVKWLVDSGTMFDSENTLIHAILSSNENVNVLIIDDGQAIAKRDVGLYALEYGNAYVASICPLYSYSKAVQALKEAADFKGPSIIILFAPDSNQNENTDQLQRVKLAKDAIEDGTISLYRWNSVKLEVDSNKPKIALEIFLKKQADLSLILEEKDVDDKKLVNHMDHLVVEAAKKSFKQLHGALNKTKLLILYGSDGGNGQSLAKRIGFEAREKGLLPKVMPMDDFNGDDLPLEEHILFIVSTAGQGEFPANARELSRYLEKATVNLSSLSYSVFALGDSHYWPRSEDAHFFCKAGKDLDGYLQKLGAKQLSTIGLGDDRDPDGYSTAFNKWVSEFWQSLGVDSSVVDNGANAPSDDAIKAASNYLRGTIAKGLLDESTGSLFEYDTKLTKFHGIYQQDDRDLREYRARKGMEKAYSFMIRVRVPGGVSTPRQYLAMDEIADKYANSTIKITTRQAFQFHGVFKSVLKRTIQDINKSLLGILLN
jgi:sulfite reductase (NADPH) hemoprotein beta-component